VRTAKAGGVVIDPDAHPAGVAGEVVDPAGHGLALGGAHARGDERDRRCGSWHRLELCRGGARERVFRQQGLCAAYAQTAERIAANSPSAVQAVKQQVSATIADHARSREALEQELGDRVRASAHFREGVAAFREKRQPRYE
jgi:enoyl-CoA hydratase/carnithine racemase